MIRNPVTFNGRTAHNAEALYEYLNNIATGEVVMTDRAVSFFMGDLLRREPNLVTRAKLPGLYAGIKHDGVVCLTMQVVFDNGVKYPINLEQLCHQETAPLSLRILMAARNEVSEKITRDLKDDEEVVHLDLSFVEVFNKWSSDFWLSRKEPSLKILLSLTEDGLHEYFTDRRVAGEWRAYHAQFARLGKVQRGAGWPVGFIHPVHLPVEEFDMNLEAAIVALTEAVKENTAALKAAGGGGDAVKATRTKKTETAAAANTAAAATGLDDGLDGGGDGLSEPTFTPEQVKAALIELKNKKGPAASSAAMASVGATSLGSIKPESFAKVMAEAKKLLG